jgi:hypothetical protein
MPARRTSEEKGENSLRSVYGSRNLISSIFFGINPGYLSIIKVHPGTTAGDPSRPVDTHALPVPAIIRPLTGSKCSRSGIPVNRDSLYHGRNARF